VSQPAAGALAAELVSQPPAQGAGLCIPPKKPRMGLSYGILRRQQSLTERAHPVVDVLRELADERQRHRDALASFRDRLLDRSRSAATHQHLDLPIEHYRQQVRQRLFQIPNPRPVQNYAESVIADTLAGITWPFLMPCDGCDQLDRILRDGHAQITLPRPTPRVAALPSDEASPTLDPSPSNWEL
jgi:hypothetical protein